MPFTRFSSHGPCGWRCLWALVFVLAVSGRPAAAVQEANEPNAPHPRVSLNFDQVDIRAVVKTIGDITGINFVLDDKVAGTVTVMSPTDIPLTDAYGVLESILEVHGFAAIPAGSVVKILPKPDAARQNLPVRVGSDPNQIPVDDTILTQILPLRYARASEISMVVQAMVSNDVKIAAVWQDQCPRGDRYLGQDPLHRPSAFPARRRAVQRPGQDLRLELRLGPGSGRADRPHHAEGPVRLRIGRFAVRDRPPASVAGY